MAAHSGKLMATAREFTPLPTLANKVLDATFVSQTIPDISKLAGVIGLCAVPQERAGADDLGWHIADFLAFKSLLCGENNPRSQTWLAQCDIASLVKDYPEYYTHGKDKRVVSGAAESLTYAKNGTFIDRDDNIQVESSAEELKVKFIEAITGKVHVAKTHGFPLVIIVCGLTSLEQDVFFLGKANGEFRLTSNELRHTIGDGIEVTVITPALFSAGWQINPSFCSLEVENVRLDRTDFLARQFGGIFAKDLVDQFLSWKCPMLDDTQVNERIRIRERYPGPVMPNDQQHSLFQTLKSKIHSYLLGRCSLHHQDHSFHFDQESDDWEKLIRPRAHRRLEEYKKKWESLRVGTASSNNTALPFLGNVFGGTRSSQLLHIKHLMEESFTAWPGYWNTSFGRNTMQDFKKFTKASDALVCHEFFNTLEHRATLNVLADMVVRYFALPMPDNVQCRDWDQPQWRTRSSEEQEKSLIPPYQLFCGILPAPNLPPGVNRNNLSRIQKRHDTPTLYLTASLGIRFGTAAQQIQAATNRIKDAIENIKIQQAKLLVGNPEVREMCIDWLRAIDMPIRQVGSAHNPAIDWRGFAVPELPNIDDEDEEYEVVLAEHLSPEETVQNENEDRDGNPSDRETTDLNTFHGMPTPPRNIRNVGEEGLPESKMNDPGLVKPAAEAPMAENIKDRRETIREKEDKLFQSLMSMTDEKSRQSILNQMAQLRAQLKDLELKASEETKVQGTNTKVTPVGSQAVLARAGSSTNSTPVTEAPVNPTLEQKDVNARAPPNKPESAMKAVAGVPGDRHLKTRHISSSQMDSDGARKSTAAIQNKEPQVKARPLATGQASLNQDRERDSDHQSGDAQMNNNNGVQAHDTQERIRETPTLEQRPVYTPTTFDFSKVKW